MIAFYRDQAKTMVILAAEGSDNEGGFWVESLENMDDVKGEVYRNARARLKSWSVAGYKKYEDVILVENAQKDTVQLIKDLERNHTEFYYAPDTREDALYHVKLDIRIPATYSPLSRRYSMQVKVREI